MYLVSNLSISNLGDIISKWFNPAIILVGILNSAKAEGYFLMNTENNNGSLLKNI